MEEMAMIENGTLMWIGDHRSHEFAEAFSFCEANVAQLAIRRSLAEAVKRPAAAVDRIVVTQATRHSLDTFALQALASEYSQASFLKLQGTLCEGMRSPAESQWDHIHYWHQWNQVLPAWIASPPGSGSSRESRGDRICRSVAIVAQHQAAAEPLMDLAESVGVTVVGCPGGSPHQVRNVDAVWWDDSVATPVSSLAWQQRIAKFNRDGRQVQHAWIVNAPRPHQHQQAIGGGVHLVVSKPHRIECLLSSIAAPAKQITAQVRAA